MTDQICAIEGCESPVARGRKTFCGASCAREGRRIRAREDRAERRFVKSKNPVSRICFLVGCNEKIPEGRGPSAKYCGDDCAKEAKKAQDNAPRFKPATPDYSSMDTEPGIIMIKRDDLRITP